MTRKRRTKEEMQAEASKVVEVVKEVVEEVVQPDEIITPVLDFSIVNQYFKRVSKFSRNTTCDDFQNIHFMKYNPIRNLFFIQGITNWMSFKSFQEMIDYIIEEEAKLVT